MKKIVIEVLACGVLLASAGCVRTEMPNLSEGEIVVRLSIDGMVTKAEDDILSGHIYLFDKLNAAPYKTIDIASGTTTLDFATVFDSDADKLKRTTVFAVTGESSAASPSSLADLKDNAITAPLFLDGNKVKADPQFYMTAEGKFEKVNDSQTTCNLTLKRLAAKVALELDIPASITTNGNWEFKSGTTYPATTTWTPMTSGENARVYLQNAVSNTTLGAASDPAVLPTSFTTFTYAPVFMNGATVSAPFYTYPVSWTRGDEKEPFIKLILPWRYTTTVVKGGKNVVVDENVVEFYYKIMFPAGITSFEANTYYLPKVTLNILGGEAARPTVIGADGLTVMDWKGVTSSDDMSEVSINSADYLIPEQTKFEVSNGNPLVVKFFSSSNITYTVDRIYKTVYQNADTLQRIIKPKDSVEPAIKDIYSDDWFEKKYDPDSKSGTLTLKHTLSSSFNDDNFAARPYIYELTLTKDADPAIPGSKAISKKIKITQNPPVLAEGIRSTGWVCVNGTTSNFGTKYRARTSSDVNVSSKNATTATGRYINVNKYSPNELGAVNTYAYLGGNVNNCSEYMVLVRVAPYSGVFVDDSREDLSGYSSAADGDGLYGVINMHRTGSGAGTGSGVTYNISGSPLTNTEAEITSIRNYKPSRKSNSANNIAPEFLVASSYGKASATAYENAALRCASYQEDGYPAGRWRLPTEKEIEYCMKLNELGAIPDLFYEKSTLGVVMGYRASSGRRRTSTQWYNEGDRNTDDTNSDANAFVRCVYDTWYWGREPKADLKDETYTEEGKTYQKYKWSGYQDKYIVNK